MDKKALFLDINNNNIKKEEKNFLEKKHKRDQNQKHKNKPWIPYSKLPYEERKKISDRESFKDHIKQQVFQKFLKRILETIQNS